MSIALIFAYDAAQGDVITLIEKHPNGWYLGQLNGQQGLFPGNYVQEL
jgi:hypothetical protein